MIREGPPPCFRINWKTKGLRERDSLFVIGDSQEPKTRLASIARLADRKKDLGGSGPPILGQATGKHCVKGSRDKAERNLSW